MNLKQFYKPLIGALANDKIEKLISYEPIRKPMVTDRAQFVTAHSRLVYNYFVGFGCFHLKNGLSHHFESNVLISYYICTENDFE